MQWFKQELIKESDMRHNFEAYKETKQLIISFYFHSRASTLFIYDNLGEYMPTEITGGKYTAYTCIYPRLQPCILPFLLT